MAGGAIGEPLELEKQARKPGQWQGDAELRLRLRHGALSLAQAMVAACRAREVGHPSQRLVHKGQDF